MEKYFNEISILNMDRSDKLQNMCENDLNLGLTQTAYTVNNGNISDTFASVRSLRTRNQRKVYPIKVRQKRQTMQNMTRPLKQWLCSNRHNPYPSKRDKEILCNLSSMSLTQVSNWFANARRRLKSTVKGEEFSWSSRVKLYNSHVEGNAELLSISSEDSIFDSDDNTDDGRQIPKENQQGQIEQNEPMEDVVPSRSQTPTRGPLLEHDFIGPLKTQHETGSQNKFKQTILQRYLSDTNRHHSGHVHSNLEMDVSAFTKTRSRRPSGSIGSRDYEEMSTSSGVSLNDSYSYSYFDVSDNTDELESAARRRRISGDVHGRNQDDIHLKEISAVMALTSLARSRSRYPIM